MRLIIRLCLLILIMLLLISCDLPTDSDNVHIPIWQTAIFTINPDGTDKEKVLDAEYVSSVEFVPSSTKILYKKLNGLVGGSSLYVFDKVDSTEVIVSGDIDVAHGDMTISADGQELIFWGTRGRHLPYYDLYQYSFNSDTISNLTYTSDKGEKDATFIEYNNEDYLMYSCYFDSLEISYKSLVLMSLSDNTTQTIHLEEIDQSIGYSWPLYDNENDILFVQSGYHDLMQSSPMIGGYLVNIAECTTGRMYADYEQKYLYFTTNYLIQYNYQTGEQNQIALSHYFHYHNNKILHTYSSQDVSDNIYIIHENSQQNLLTSNGSIPKFSSDNEKIIYFGQYEINE